MSENSPKPTITTTPKGIATALVAFLIWGNFPFYFKQLANYDAVEIIVHRVVWTFVVLLAIMVVTGRKKWWQIIKDNPKWLVFTFLAALLIGTNWLTYVWAVNHDMILEASLGYFINPLMGVALSLLVFKEKLRSLQWLAVALAVVAVGVQAVWLGGVPWISLAIAASFAFYAVIQRQTPLEAMDGLFLETLLLLPLGILWLSHANVASSAPSFWWSPSVLLLMLAGPITLVPLLLYNKSTKMVSFSILSFMNYLTPSLIFLLAIFYYHEPFDMRRIFVFGLIWVALALFSVDALRQRRLTKA